MTISETYFIDNIEGMKKYPDGYFDLALCDIEYGIGASKPSKKPILKRQKNGNFLKVNNPIYTPKEWDFSKSTDAYFEQLFRVSKNQIVFGGNYYPQLSGGAIVWDKINGCSDQYGCEIAYQSFNNRTDIIYYMWAGMFQGKYCGKDIRKAMVQQGNKSLNEKRIHETQKPVILYEYLLDEYAKTGQKIIDTHMGSQSLRIAAYKKGLHYVGFENDQEHFDNGENRFYTEIEAYENLKLLQKKQLSLF